MNTELKQLLELQEIDRVIDQLNLDLKKMPLVIEEKRSLIKQEMDLFEEKKKKSVEFQLMRKEKEIELSSQEEKIRKHESELNSVKSNDAYKALLSEIAAAKEQKSKVEDEILTLMVEMDNVVADLKKMDSEAKEHQKKSETEIQGIEAQTQELKEQLDEQTKRRQEFATHLPAESLSVYDFIRRKKKGVAIVSIEGESCSGCHTTLTQSTINEVKKKKKMVNCDSCSRILYEPEPMVSVSTPTVQT